MRRSTLLAGGLAVTMAVLLVIAMLMGRTTEPAGKTVVTVRLWDPQVAAAYRESFDAFSAEHPGIEVRVNTVAYASYFDSLRTDVAGGSADDIFWISNGYFAGYADNGHLLDIADLLGPDAATAWEPSVVEQFTRNGPCGAYRNSPMRASRCTTTRTCWKKPGCPRRPRRCAGRTAPTTPCGRCWRA